MMKIYGNENLLSTLDSMVSSGRTAHAVIFYGEKGSGRKLMADRYTAALLCESPVNGTPCGHCKSCRCVVPHSHPDVTYVPTSGKLGGYSVETVRSVIHDAFTRPSNNSGRKVYIFRDCRKMDSRTQNALLKLVEEPPEYVNFIFTTESKYEFLPTIISRCVCFGVNICTEEEAFASLCENGCKEDEAREAVSVFHGNIGRCIDYLYDQELRKRVDLTKRLSDSIIRKDEYSLNSAFYTVSSGRNDTLEILSMLDKMMRDAAVLAKDPSAKIVGCGKDAAERLSTVIAPYQSARIHYRLEKARSAIDANVNIPLVLAALCADIISIVA